MLAMQYNTICEARFQELKHINIKILIMAFLQVFDGIGDFIHRNYTRAMYSKIRILLEIVVRILGFPYSNMLRGLGLLANIKTNASLVRSIMCQVRVVKT